MRCCHKRKAPVAGGFQFQLVRRIGFRASAPRIRAGFARLPACSPARYGRSASASRSRLDRGSNPCLVSKKEKPPLPEASSSIGAAYRIPRIRFADPHRLRPPAGGLARGLKTLRVFLTPAPRPRFESMRRPPKRKAPVAGGFQFQLVRRIGFRASASRIRTGFARLPADSPAG